MRPGLLERISIAWEVFRNPAMARAATPQATFWERVTGHETDYLAEEYGEYLATSNPIYTCATLRADTLSSIPLLGYRLADGKQTQVLDGPVVSLLRKVNPCWTMNRLLNMTELSLCLWGQAYWVIERGASTRGKPQEIWWVKPTEMTVYPDPVNYISHYEYDPGEGLQPIRYERHEVVWFRYPNPNDQYSGLSPLAPARLAVDMGNDAVRSNRNIFVHGYQTGGLLTPDDSQIEYTQEQARELEADMDRRFRGVDKAHRFGVLRFRAKILKPELTPKDVEFLGALNWSLEEAARAYHIPLDLVGGQRTYENVRAAERAFVYRTIMPEGQFICDELVEQFLPMFGSSAGVDLITPDYERMPILQDEESAKWQREREQIDRGAITINQWRSSKGLDGLPWGDAWWAPMSVAPVKSGAAPALPKPETGAPDETGGEDAGRLMRAHLPVEYGGDDHKRLMQRFDRRVDRWVERFGNEIGDLFRRLQDSVLDKLRERMLVVEGNGRSPEGALEEPFDMPKWQKIFRSVMRELLSALLVDIGGEMLDELESDEAFDLGTTAVIRFLEGRSQRFAEEVLETTWDELRSSIAEGIANGESTVKIQGRVTAVMDGRIRSSAETIARTEVNGAVNGGQFLGALQSGLRLRKGWLAAFRNTRESHIEAHMTYQAEPIDLDEMFLVGAGTTLFPGDTGLAEEDINCNCTVQYIVED